MSTLNIAIEMECLGIVETACTITHHLWTVSSTGSQTIEQIKKNLWLFMRLVIILPYCNVVLHSQTAFSVFVFSATTNNNGEKQSGYVRPIVMLIKYVMIGG